MGNMHNESKVYVVDSVMGSGKSSAAIDYIRNSGGEKILFITPFLTEIYDRIIPQCPEKDFRTPECDSGGTKLSSLKKLLSEGHNIVSTHALFKRFDSKVSELCRRQGYTLIMDEVADVVEEYNDLNPCDAKTFFDNYVDIDPTTKLVKWKKEHSNYNGFFREVKSICDSGSLYHYRGDTLLWMLPPSVFSSFGKILILTYMFDGQFQRCYFDFFGIKYSYLYVKYDGEKYCFTDNPLESKTRINYKELIHIIDKPKLNAVGNDYYALSKAWYSRSENADDVARLKKNIYNFFNNIACGGESVSANNIWTTFKCFKSKLRGKGYSKGFLSINSRSTNMYGNRTAVAYPVNLFYNSFVSNFFRQAGVEVDEDAFALSEMLQFIWRSAIRNNKSIDLYIPSSRMRKLLMDWVDENSV